LFTAFQNTKLAGIQLNVQVMGSKQRRAGSILQVVFA